MLLWLSSSPPGMTNAIYLKTWRGKLKTQGALWITVALGKFSSKTVECFCLSCTDVGVIPWFQFLLWIKRQTLSKELSGNPNISKSRRIILYHWT